MFVTGSASVSDRDPEPSTIPAGDTDGTGGIDVYAAITVVTAVFAFAARSLPHRFQAYEVHAGLPAHWLAIAGGIIGLATLATGALRNAVLAVHLRFDAYYLLLYGLYFTGVLAVAFAPSYLAMRNTGARLRDRSFPLPDPNDSSCFDVLTKRKSFDDLIQLNLWASATFKAGVAILAPLASA